MNEYFPCPACEHKARLKHYVAHAGHAQLYFACIVEDCRNHFQVLRMPGQLDKVVAQSPHKVTPGPNTPEAERFMPVVGRMGCPECGQYGKIKMTERRDDGYWRRHKCLVHGYYYTVENPDGGISVHKKQRSKLAIDLTGEAA